VTRAPLATLLALLALPAPAGADTQAGLAAISEGSAKESVDYLASDDLEGRGSGAEGGRKAGAWLAERLGELGLEPLGDEGTYFQRFEVDGRVMRNVVATIPGRTPGEAVVIGAHYDHLGLGDQPGSLAFGAGRGEVHNGADDNASGTAAVLEVAKAFVASGVAPERRLVFAFFDGEERGLLGSKRYAADPPTADRTVLMINLDMVGRLDGGRLRVAGANTGDKLPGWLDAANEAVGLDLAIGEALSANSDHAPFYEREVPVLVPFTGLHTDYHRPSDDVEDVDAKGVADVARLCFGVAVRAAETTEPIAFARAKDGSGMAMLEQLRAMLGADRFGEQLERLRGRLGLDDGAGLEELADRLGDFLGGGRRRSRARLGVTVAPAEGGLAVESVTEGSVAAAAGFASGDVIVGYAGEPVDGIPGLRRRIAATEGRAAVEVRRGGEAVTLTVDFGGGDEDHDAEPTPSGPEPRHDGSRWY